MSARILVVEDEESLARGLELNLRLEGWAPQVCGTLADARRACARARPDLVLLDLNLPDGDGLELLEELGRAERPLPVLVLTARASDEERIAGLSLGADDYVTKPFHLPELVLRVRNLLRRTAPASGASEPAVAPPEEIRIGEATLRAAESLLLRGGERHLLTQLELSLLLHLWRSRGRWVTREELLVRVWGYTATTSTRTVDIFVSRLRRLLGDDAAAPALLLTRRGVGYMLAG